MYCVFVCNDYNLYMENGSSIAFVYHNNYIIIVVIYSHSYILSYLNSGFKDVRAEDYQIAAFPPRHFQNIAKAKYRFLSIIFIWHMFMCI